MQLCKKVYIVPNFHQIDLVVVINGRESMPNSGLRRVGERAATWRPLPIMRLTALLPPPPTPTTFILAVSTGANEHRAVVRRGRLWSRHPLRGEARR